jgi:hypothetical protein
LPEMSICAHEHEQETDEASVRQCKRSVGIGIGETHRYRVDDGGEKPPLLLPLSVEAGLEAAVVAEVDGEVKLDMTVEGHERSSSSSRGSE